MTSRDSELNYENLPEALRFVCDQLVKKVHTAIPAVVQSYAAGPPARATVQPVVGLMLSDGTTRPRAAIADVPVAWPGTSQWVFTAPLARGDVVLLVYCERDISGFKQSGAVGRLPSDRIMDDSDCVAIPWSHPEDFTAATAAGVAVQSADGNTSVVVEDSRIVLDKDATTLVVEDGEITLNADTVTINHSGGQTQWPP